MQITPFAAVGNDDSQIILQFCSMQKVQDVRNRIIQAAESVWTLSKPLPSAVWSADCASVLACPVFPKRIVVRVEVPDVRVECFTERQSFTSWWQGAPEALFDVLWACNFGNVLVQLVDSDETILRSAKLANRVTVLSQKPSRTSWVNVVADKTVQHVMSAALRERIFAAFDFTTSDGRIKAGMSDKARQVNRLVDRAFSLAVVRNALSGESLSIVDAGCGKAYLSIALAAALQERGVAVQLRGIDGNEHVVAVATAVANALGLPNATFSCEAIDKAAAMPADVFVALHACDTASDDAIMLALACSAKAMLIAPCCHKEVQRQLRESSVPDAFKPLLRDGIQKERLGDLITDAVRRDVVRSNGYDAHLEEFVALEHTAKNVLLVAERKAAKSNIALEDVVYFCQQWGVTSSLLEISSR